MHTHTHTSMVRLSIAATASVSCLLSLEDVADQCFEPDLPLFSVSLLTIINKFYAKLDVDVWP